MDIHDDLDLDRSFAQQEEDIIRAEYPEQADQAKSIITRFLRRYDKQRYLVYTGQIEDKHFDLGRIYSTQHFLSMILWCKDDGQPVEDWYLEHIVRSGLGLGFTAIKGGQS